VAAAAAKKKEDDVAALAQAVTATAHREQKAFVAIVIVTRKTMDEARACSRAAHPRLGEGEDHHSSTVTTAHRCSRNLIKDYLTLFMSPEFYSRTDRGGLIIWYPS
jgi:hypothetical protein